MSVSSASARRVALIYLALSVVWIAGSDYLLAILSPDPATSLPLQTAKGWFFVTASAVFIWWLARREMERLSRVHSRFQTLAEQGIAGFYVIRGGRFAYCNDRLAEIFGYSTDEVIGRSALELAAPDERDRVAEALRQPEDGSRSRIQHEFQGLRSDGERVPVEVIGRAVSWEGNPCIAGVLIDVTERAALENQLRQAMRVEAVGHLTGSVVHDFNNLLTAILGQLDLARMELPPESPAHNEIGIARDTARRAAMLTRKLLAFTRSQVHRPRPIAPNARIREMEALLQSLTSSPIRLHLDLAPDAPATVMDPADFDQLVMNLYINATQAIEAQGDVWIRTQESAGEFVLEVQDNGIGMDERTVARIFDPFFTTKDRGTGLGLAAVLRIVDEGSGKITVESQPGSGTTFRVGLPAAKMRGGELPAEPDAAAGGGPFTPATVLVIDDEPTVLRVMRSALTRAGYDVIAAVDGETALPELERQDKIDLMIVDVSLPRMSGPEFVEKALLIRPDVAVIFTSGYASADLRARQVSISRYPFIEKPFSVEALLGVTSRTLAGPHHSGDEAAG